MPETGNPYVPYSEYNPYDQDYGTPGYQAQSSTPVAPRPSNQGSNWISGIEWDERGRPYRTYLMNGPGYTAGQRTYVSPAEPHPSNTDDQRLLDWAAQNGRPGQTLLRDAGVWDSKKGEWKRAPNWTNIASMAVGAGIAAPFVVPAVSGLFGSGAAPGAAGLTNTAAPGALSTIAAPTAGTSAAVSSGIATPLVNTAATGALSTIAAPALPAALSSAVPAAAQTALPLAADFTAETIAALPAATNALPQIASAALPGALPAVPAIRNLFQQDDQITADRTEQPDRTGDEPGSRGTLPEDTIQGPGMPPEDRAQTQGLPFGLTGRDLFNYGSRWLENYFANRSANERSDASIAASQEALEFAKKQYEDLLRRDQERWDATEARRVPYRQASLSSLTALRQMLGI